MAKKKVVKNEMTPAEVESKKARILKRRERNEKYQANVKALKENKALWAAFTSLRSEIGQMNGDRKVAVQTLRRALSASVRVRKVDPEKLEEKLASLNAKRAQLEAELKALQS